ncbi:ImmA/IrrE family metallo-endopeptidase [Cellulosimicrobium cellulans]|uniref:ImmA/IrrE family metallo-endopeptidase n=1 Tax=Cellulosimicrobium cellulans TaxID=1710 RepID=UPI0036E65C35
MTEETRAALDAKLGELHQRLMVAVEQLVTGEDWKRALQFAARFRARSFRNALLILAQHEAAFQAGRVPRPVPSYVAGYKQWLSLGRQVERGQAGYMIFAPLTGRFASSTPQDLDSWRRLGKFEKPRPGEVARSRMVGAKTAYVWDVSLTRGDPIPERPAVPPLAGVAPSGLWDGLAALTEAEGFAVQRVPDAAAIGGADGRTHYEARTVSVREDLSAAEQAVTLAHELAHVRLHGANTRDATDHRGIREVEAESVAMMVAAAHDMQATRPSALYVAEWANSVEDKRPEEVVQETGERVRRAVASILDALPTVQVGTGDPPGLVRDAPAPSEAPTYQASVAGVEPRSASTSVAGAEHRL